MLILYREQVKGMQPRTLPNQSLLFLFLLSANHCAVSFAFLLLLLSQRLFRLYVRLINIVFQFSPFSFFGVCDSLVSSGGGGCDSDPRLKRGINWKQWFGEGKQSVSKYQSTKSVTLLVVTFFIIDCREHLIDFLIFSIF